MRERRAHIGDPLQQRFDQFLTDALVEGGEDDSGMTFLAASPRGTPLIERGTREARDEQWASNNQTTWGSSSIQFWNSGEEPRLPQPRFAHDRDGSALTLLRYATEEFFYYLNLDLDFI